MNIIGYTYEADYHCVDCTENRFGQDDLGYAFTVDNEDNLVHPIFSTDEIAYSWDYRNSFDTVCGDCAKEIE